MIESLKTLIANALKNECSAFFAPVYPSEMKMQQGAIERHVYKREAHTQATSKDAASSFPMGIESALSSGGQAARSNEIQPDTAVNPVVKPRGDGQLRDENMQPLQIYAQEILNAHLYPLTAQGKLIRPLLVLLTAGSIGGKNAVQNALPAALAVECVHTYSLVHDDLPCMDNDILRRGKPTTHVVYGDAKALLVGDGLLTAAFEILSNDSTATDVSFRGTDRGIQNFTKLKLINCLSNAIGTRGMIFGQWLDISEAKFLQSDLLNASSAKWEMFHTMHKNKTGKLFGACFEMGLLTGLESQNKENKIYSEEYLGSVDIADGADCSCASVRSKTRGAPRARRARKATSNAAYAQKHNCNLHRQQCQQSLRNMQKRIFQIGLDVGLSFQIFDDILDATQDSKALGKTAGKDAIQNKLTAVKILGLKAAQQYADECLNSAIQNLQSLMNKDFESIFQKNEEYFSTLLKLLRSVSCHPAA